jgi:EAL domain-containing protein (putative c-di-GMP-specific phosphodiesterase class I)
MAATVPVEPVEAVEFEKLLADRAVEVLFQPIAYIDSGDVIGYEALARGPAGSSFESPEDLFAYAYRTGREAELDWACWAEAIRQAIAARLPDTAWLFINAEPRSFGSVCPPDLVPVVNAARGRLRILLEVTERAITTDPARLLRAVAQFRRRSMGLALDDVGAYPSSLAMMPLLRPDVIKLDLRLVRDAPTLGLARTLTAVLVQAEHTGATILAEGVETPRQVDVARALGATLGQGWFYGRPKPLPRHFPPSPNGSVLDAQFVHHECAHAV